MRLRQIARWLALAGVLSGAGVYAAAASPADAPAADAPAGGHGWHHGMRGFGGMGFVLHKLNLSADQKAQIKALMQSQKSEFESLRSAAQANRQALATTPPTDPGYPALIQTAQQNAAKRIELMSQTWKQVYESVLTQEQRAQIPGIVAAAQAKRRARIEAWKSQHAAPATSD